VEVEVFFTVNVEFELVFMVLKAPFDFKFDLPMSRTSLGVYVNFKISLLTVDKSLQIAIY